MTPPLRLKPLLWLSGLALLLSVAVARADLSFILTPAVQTGAVSNEVSFTGTLTNTSLTDYLYLNNLQFSLTGAASNLLAADANVFFANVPGILSPLETYHDVVFAVTLSPATPPGQYFGVVTIQGGTNISAATDLASAGFAVSVPLPALSIALSGTNLVLLWSSFPADFGLQQNSSLTTTNWQNLTNSPTVTNSQSEVILAPSGNSQFYRLEHP